MKRQIVVVITAMFVGAMLFGSSVQAQGPTTEERLQRLESVVNGDASTITGETIKTAASGTRVEMTGAGGDSISWYYRDALVGRIDSSPGQLRVLADTFNLGNVIVNGALDHNGTTAGFYGVRPVSRQSLHFLDSATTGKQMRSRFNALLAKLERVGLITVSGSP